MKIGIKLFNEEEVMQYLQDKADFFEIMALQNEDYSYLQESSKPVIIHAEHQRFGINPADISKKEMNLKSLDFARKIADMINAKKIIVHPGHLEHGNKNCSLENAVDFFNKIDDERILIENLPPMKGARRLCMTPEITRMFLERTGKGFCFDVNHAIQAREFNGRYDFIKQYLSLNPFHYHFGGQEINGRDHLSLRESELNLRKILEYYPKNAEISLETAPAAEKYEKERDLKIIRDVIRRLGK